LTNHGHSVVFATESGSPATADDIMLTGRGLDIWSAVPLLGRSAFLGRFLRANRDARDAYANMLQSPEYQQPVHWTAATIDDVDALLLPGGHRARGMRGYIDSDTLHRLVVEAFTRGLVVAAICHGVLLAARITVPRQRDRLTTGIRCRRWHVLVGTLARRHAHFRREAVREIASSEAGKCGVGNAPNSILVMTSRDSAPGIATSGGAVLMATAMMGRNVR
jgi:putative intracellular protease/amidase